MNMFTFTQIFLKKYRNDIIYFDSWIFQHLLLFGILGDHLPPRNSNPGGGGGSAWCSSPDAGGGGSGQVLDVGVESMLKGVSEQSLARQRRPGSLLL